MDKIEELVTANLDLYRKFIDNFNFQSKYIKCLFTNAYNHFLAAKILADSGLMCQSYNCLRMGLESEWLGIYYLKHIELSYDWAFGTGNENARKIIKKMERPADLRREISKFPGTRLKENDRNEIYSVLSDKSHSKLASCAVITVDPTSNDQSQYKVECVPPGGLKGEISVSILLHAVQVVQEFAMADIEDTLNVKLLPENWNFIRATLSKISHAGWTTTNGEFEPFISSKNRPGSDPICYSALLEAIRNQSLNKPK